MLRFAQPTTNQALGTTMVRAIKYILVALVLVAGTYGMCVKQLLNAANTCNSLLYPKTDGEMQKVKEASEDFSAKFSACMDREMKFPASLFFRN
jgi:UDP-N-acetylenolpyruvoylglucosamine reductase